MLINHAQSTGNTTDTVAPTSTPPAPPDTQPPDLDTSDVTQSPAIQRNITQENHTRPPEEQSLSNDVTQPTISPILTQTPASTGTTPPPPDIDTSWTSLINGPRMLQMNDSLVSRNDDTEQPSHVRDTGDAEETQLRRIYKELTTIKSHLQIKDNEIELLSMEVKSVYTVIGLLQQRISDLEQRNKSTGQCEAATSVPAPSFRLLLGDSNFRRVLQSDLEENCSVKTIVKADMDLLGSWVSENLQSIPSECIIYGGMYDILAEKTPDNILDCLGSLISNLKEKNSEMKIYVCQVVPVPGSPEIASKISDYNEQLFKWSETNGVNLVKTPPEFTFGTGNVDELCFDVEGDISCILNRLGAIRLLNTFKKQCPGYSLCKNWEKVRKNISGSKKDNQKEDQGEKQRGEHHQRKGRVSTSSAHPAPNTPHYTPNTHTLPTPPPAPHSQAIPSPPPHHLNPTHHTSYTQPQHRAPPHPPHVTQRLPPRPVPTIEKCQTYYSVHPPPVRRAPPYSYRDAVQRNITRNMDNEQQTNYGNIRNDYYVDTAMERREAERCVVLPPAPPRHAPPPRAAPHYYTPRTTYTPHTNYRPGCYNCGEHNHRQGTCRFDYRLRCGSCHKLGHKQKRCYYNNSK